MNVGSRGSKKDHSLITFRALLTVLLLAIAGYLASGQAYGQTASSITLAWNRTSGANTAGYRLYYGASSRNYTNVVDARTATNATVSVQKNGTTYYFAVTAYSPDGLESSYSSEISYTPSPTAPQGLTFASTAGTITAPFAANNGMVSQTVETGVTTGGRAAYSVSIPAAGDYLVTAVVVSPSEAANSFFVNFDSEPTDPTMIWDAPVSASAITQTVSWRGTGTSTNAQYSPKLFTLSAGTHQLIIRGREANAQLGTITIVPKSTTVTPPSIALTSPANNSSYTAPAAIPLAATVTPNGHTITKVQFYNGSTLLAESTVAPYAYTWSNVAAASYALSARAIYDSGSTVSSSTTTVTVAPLPPPPTTSVTFASTSGSLSGPYLTSNGAVSQSTTTTVSNGWRGVYTFTISSSGDYLVSASVNAPDSSANSLYVNVDAEPTDPLTIWDIPVGPGFTSQTVSWRGNGSTSTGPSGFTAQFSPKVFNLAAGTHQLIIRGREAGTQLGSLTISPAVTLPAPWQVLDIGNVGTTGSSSITGGVYTVSGAGTLSGSSDSFRFLYQPMSGDGEIRARLNSIQNTSTNARMGVLVRETLSPSARYCFLGVAPDGRLRSQNRSTTAGSTSTTTLASGTLPNLWARLVRSNSTFYSYWSTNGTAWTLANSVSVPMATNIYFGFGTASGQSGVLNTSSLSAATVVP